MHLFRPPVKPPFLYRFFFPFLTWKIPSHEKVIYLTFDDGPIPEVTPWVIQELKKFKAKATFFCIGDNIKKNRDVYQMLLDEGHQTGNHTFNHLNGWHVSTDEYVKNTNLAAEFCKSNLFRPPYGRIKFRQSLAIRKKFKIIMWDVLSYDYDKDTSPERCLKNVIDHATAGSIIVFHDSLKAEKNLRYALPEVLTYFSQKNFRFEIIERQ